MNNVNPDLLRAFYWSYVAIWTRGIKFVLSDCSSNPTFCHPHGGSNSFQLLLFELSTCHLLWSSLAGSSTSPPPHPLFLFLLVAAALLPLIGHIHIINWLSHWYYFWPKGSSRCPTLYIYIVNIYLCMFSFFSLLINQIVKAYTLQSHA